MADYGFTEGVDFNPYKIVRVQDEGGRQVSREVTDDQLTIDMAKELCMIQRNEKVSSLIPKTGHWWTVGSWHRSLTKTTKTYFEMLQIWIVALNLLGSILSRPLTPTNGAENRSATL